jgi:hypothetical protein
MGFQIQDGTGSSKKVKVSSSNKLFAEAVIRTEREEEALLGEAYIVGSGFVELTTTGTSAVLYFKNNEDVDLIVTEFLFAVRDSTGGTTSHIRVDIIKNPISMGSGSGTDLNISNINFGSSNTVNSDSEIGQEGSTLNNGTTYLLLVAPLDNLTTEVASTIIPKGSSIGVNVVPPTSNTALEVNVEMKLHKLTEELL